MTPTLALQIAARNLWTAAKWLHHCEMRDPVNVDDARRRMATALADLDRIRALIAANELRITTELDSLASAPP